MTRVAHISDIHVPAGAVGWMHAMFARVDSGRLPSLLADVARQRPDVLLVTGDVTVRGSHQEYEACADLLRSTGVATVLAVPGNHDVMAEDATEESRFFEHLGWACPGGRCPWVWDSPTTRIVGLNSAIFTGRLKDHHGEVGLLTIEWLEKRLAAWAGDDRTTIVALHHDVLPPLTGDQEPEHAGDDFALGDAALLHDVCARGGVSVIVHGHRHRSFFRLADGAPHIICPGSATNAHGAKYGIYDIMAGGRYAMRFRTWSDRHSEWMEEYSARDPAAILVGGRPR
jgi:3',5'-cyclic AMP phosphodiesterase CpdA